MERIEPSVGKQGQQRPGNPQGGGNGSRRSLAWPLGTIAAAIVIGVLLWKQMYPPAPQPAPAAPAAPAATPPAATTATGPEHPI
ncbi:MAG TPA: hypothetical protein VKT00_12405, partial [Casimicrobiaceae bacterium]|nr:hypothetical protein [Casimicrobiaceae bacterium]